MTSTCTHACAHACAHVCACTNTHAHTYACRHAQLGTFLPASVGDALEIMHIVKERFRLDYVDMLNRITERYSKPVICTIYNNVPLLPNDALTALALFNEVILEEAFNRRLSVIDLRIVCNEAGDYSEVSPIEPSYSGGIKIAKVIKRAIDTIGFNANESVVFS